MSEREISRLYIAEMRALLPVLQSHLSTLGASVPATQRAVAASELGRLALAAADLSADFHAEDCATLSATLARSFPAQSETPISPMLLAPAADALTYLHNRVKRMDGSHRILAPSERDRATVARLLTALTAATGSTATEPLGVFEAPNDIPPPDDSSASSSLVGAPVFPPLAPEDPLPPQVADWSPSLADAPPPDPDPIPVLPDDALTYPALPLSPNGRAGGEPLGAAAPVEDLPRDPLSDEDLAVLHAFKSGPLVHGTRPLVNKRPMSEAHDASEAAPDTTTDDVSSEWHTLFVFETSQDLQEMQRDLTAFEQHPEDRARLASVVRLAHKIKGAASTLGFTTLGSLAHQYEDQLGIIRSQRVPADAATLSIMLRGLGELEKSVAAISIGQDDDPQSMDRMRDLTTTLMARAADQSDAAISSMESTPDTADSSGSLSVARSDPGTMRSPDQDNSAPLLTVRAPGTESLLRVDVRRMDDLMNRVSTLAINRAEVTQVRGTAAEAQADMEHAIARLNDLSGRLADLQPLVNPPASPPTTTPVTAAPPTHPPRFMARLLGGSRRAEAAASPAVPDANAAATHFDELELERYTEYDQLTRALSEAVADVSSSAAAFRSIMRRLESLGQAQEGLTSAIQEAVTQVRLVPLSEQVSRLQRTTRVLATELGKQVTFTVEGESTEIDRDVSEALSASLLQLVRNAVAHGIEPPDEREILGKPLQGHVWLRAYSTGNEAHIEIGDDGRGINPDQVIASARLAGILDAQTARDLNPDTALNLIFEHGVSTVAEATAAAGHGIGMAEVAETLAHLRGTIDVRSVQGQGTTFHIHVPISLSIVRVLQLRVAEQAYTIPFSSVLQTIPVPPASTDADGPAPHTGAGRRVRARIGEREVEVPVFALADLLGLPYTPSPHETAVVAAVGRQHAAFIVDAIDTDSEVVVRSLPAHLRRRSVRGATITPLGEVLLLLDLPELITRVARLGQASRRVPPVARLAPAARPRVLVVDDSLSIRRTIEATLSRAGYTVQVAHDGMEALELMLGALPVLIILDIEMPRLDGYELLSVIRAHEQFAQVRVIMLTSRGAQKHRNHAEALGADAYLVKPCPDDELIATIQRVLGST